MWRWRHSPGDSSTAADDYLDCFFLSNKAPKARAAELLMGPGATEPKKSINMNIDMMIILYYLIFIQLFISLQTTVSLLYYHIAVISSLKKWWDNCYFYSNFLFLLTCLWISLWLFRLIKCCSLNNQLFFHKVLERSINAVQLETRT